VPFQLLTINDQREALEQIAKLIAKGSRDPVVREIALQLTSDCDSRDDDCELAAIYNAVRYGTDAIPGWSNGFKYIADPEGTDWFQGARKSIEMISKGYGAGDCDDHTILVASLCRSIGFTSGACAWGKVRGEFTHVFAVVANPKRGPWPKDYYGDGMDTTVDKQPGWYPPGGYRLYAWPKDD
jgi:transglutaminase-like putative cysteine protease